MIKEKLQSYIKRLYGKSLNPFLDKLADRIISIMDYFVGNQTISLSELILCVAALGNVVSMMFVFSKNHWFSNGHVYWSSLFAVFSGIHFCGFLYESKKMRLLSLQGYCGLWLTKLITTPTEDSGLYFAALILSIIVFIRIDKKRYKDWKNGLVDDD